MFTYALCEGQCYDSSQTFESAVLFILNKIPTETFVSILLYHKTGETEWEAFAFPRMFLFFLKVKSVPNCDSVFVVRVSHVKLMVPAAVNATPHLLWWRH